jgi:hypothetical protein
MKNIITIIIFLYFISGSIQAQNKYLKFSPGYILFGTGDVQGYSIKIEYAKNFLKNSKSRLFIGPELAFETGVQNPKINNPSREDFMFGPSFYHITNTILSAKASYYPFYRIISGFYLAGGISFGYSTQSTESQADLVTLANGQTIRRSYLQFDNGIIYGYRIGSGYEFKLTKRFSTGVLIELHNYNNNDFNSFWGGNIAWHF